MPKPKWPETISDGLSLPCSMCLRKPEFDFTSEDAVWEMVVPEKYRRGVICLPCFDRLAVAAGVTHHYIKRIQFIGCGRTFDFDPVGMFVWANYERVEDKRGQ